MTETLDELTRRLLDAVSSNSFAWRSGYSEAINDVRREWSLRPLGPTDIEKDK